MTISSAAVLDYGAATNYITNGGAETNTAGWTGIGTSTIVRSTEQAHSGVASFKITYGNSVTPMVAYDPLILPADALHAFSYWVYVPASWDGGQIKIRHSSTIGGFAGSTATDELYADMSKRDQWQRISCVVDPDAADLSGRLDVCTATAPTVGRYIYVDDAQVEPGSIAHQVIDTNGAAITAELYTGSGGGASGGTSLTALALAMIGSGGGVAGGSATATLAASLLLESVGSYVPIITTSGGAP